MHVENGVCCEDKSGKVQGVSKGAQLRGYLLRAHS